MDYENEIRIEEDALDLEWLNQPSLMLSVTREQAQTMEVEDRAKENLELVKAELDMEIRSDPDAFGITKLTEATVSAAILASEKYQEASDRYLNAKFENKVAIGAVKAFEQRKDALENLVKLHGQQYFAGPSIPLNISRDAKNKHNAKSANKAVAEKMTRTK